MKKILVAVLAVMMMLCAVSASAEMMTGGWSVAQDNSITEENKAIFGKAMEKLIGVNYEPIAYLGSQLVAGMNHCFLCRATVVYPNAVPGLTLVYIYADLEGNAEITQITDLDIAALSQPAAE